MQDKFKQGPVGHVMLLSNGPINMGKNLLLWFIFCLLVSYFCAYVAASTLAAGTAGMQVFRVVSTAAIMVYALGIFSHRHLGRPALENCGQSGNRRHHLRPGDRLDLLVALAQVKNQRPSDSGLAERKPAGDA